MARKISVEILGSSASLERAFSRSSRSAKGFDRDLGRAGRGVAAATLGFHGLGRSIAFASTSFVGAAGIAIGIKDAITGAENLAKAQESVRTVLQKTGQDVGKLTPEYLATAKAAANLGVSQAEALGGLAKATTLTGNAASAMRAYIEAINISKATHVSFESALTATAKGQEGITTSLRRYGILVDKTTSGQKQFEIVMSRFGGQARANTSDLDRLKASASNLAAQLGGPLLKVADAVARGLSAAIGGISRFASKIGAQHTITGKLNVVWSGVEDAGRGLIHAFEGINWHAIEAAVGAQLTRLGTALQHVDFSKVGHLVGEKLGKALGAVADFIQHVNWSKVGKVLLEGLGAAVIFVASALPPIFKGLGRIGIALLEAGFRLAAGQLKAIGSFIGDKIKDGLEVAFHFLEREAIKLVLKIVEPFSHLPGFLGGGPFQQMKAALQSQLSQMNRSAANSANSIDRSFARMSNRVAGHFRGMASSLIASIGAAVSAVGAAVGKLKLGDVKKALAQADAAVPGQLSTKGGSKGAAAASTAPSGFTLPFRLQLAQAKASATATIKDDLKVARDIRAFILKAIPHLHGQKLIDAYNQLGQINQTIASDVQQATKKAKQAVTSFTLPPKLGLALARDNALGLDPTKDLLKAKAAILKFIRTHKKNIAALTDAYNQLGPINDQIAASVKSALGGFKQLNTRKLTDGLGLTAAARKELRARLSQVGPGGTVPGSGVGAFGFVIGSDDRPIIIHHESKIDGKVVERSTTKHQQRRRRRNSSQVRGPQGGG